MLGSKSKYNTPNLHTRSIPLKLEEMKDSLIKK